jgi:hypothetical protein
MDINELHRLLDQEVKNHNSKGVADFEGYSPEMMTNILHQPLEDKSPITLRELSESDYNRVPILNQIKYFLNLVEESGEIKLTKKGFLPTKIVADIYSQGNLKDPMIESGISKLYKETDSNTINLTRNLCELTGLAKKRNGKLSVTKKSQKYLTDNHELLRLILLTFATKFNWAYYDGYGDNNIGQIGWGFSLILLSKYGEEKRPDTFYAEKYFEAYPNLMATDFQSYSTPRDRSFNCYSIRTFKRFLVYFNLIVIDEERKGFDSKTYISKTDLFDKMFKITPPNQ